MPRHAPIKVLVVDTPGRASSLADALAGVKGVEVACTLESPMALLARVAEHCPDVVLIATDSPSRDVLEQLAGIETVHVPYKSSAQMATDLIAGRVDFAFHNAAVVLPHIQSGRLRALAVTTATRVAYAPDLPTMIEAGYRDFLFDGGGGFLVPHGTPRAVVDKLARAIGDALGTESVRQQMALHFLEPAGIPPDEFRAHIRREIARWAPIIRESAAKVD